MNGGIYLVVDAALTALSAKFERDAIVAKVRDAESKGATPEQIAAEIRLMRTDSEAEVQAELNKA